MVVGQRNILFCNCMVNQDQYSLSCSFGSVFQITCLVTGLLQKRMTSDKDVIMRILHSHKEEYLSRFMPIFAPLDRMAASAICDGANIQATSVFSALSKKSSAPFLSCSGCSTEDRVWKKKKKKKNGEKKITQFFGHTTNTTHQMLLIRQPHSLALISMSRPSSGRNGLWTVK